MSHHAFFVAGDIEEGIQSALAYGERELGLSSTGNPDVLVLRYTLFPVEEARKIGELASRVPVQGEKKLIIIAASRFFHEAQNALLKVFEEPTPGTVLVLVVPSIGSIIPTLRSRLLSLPGSTADNAMTDSVRAFISAKPEEREKLVAKLLDRAKSDKADEKQAARIEALTLATGIMEAGYPRREDAEMRAFLAELNRLIPILHERSAPLKPILEHLLISMPGSLR